MGFVNMVLGTIVAAIIGGLIWLMCLGLVMLYQSFDRATLEISCLIPIVLTFGYLLGGGIHDYRKSLKGVRAR